MKQIRFFLACTLTALAPFLFTGCEAESSADTQLNLNPRSVTLGPRQSAVFTVSGGYDYRWSLTEPGLGTLNKRTGNQVVYTVTSTNSGTQTLVVNSFIEGASGNTPTNEIGSNAVVTADSATATAIITQPGAGGTIPITPTTLTISPSSVILTPASPSVTFVITEGVSVRWAVQNGALGNPDNGAGSSFTYVATSFPTSAVSQVVEASYTTSGGSTLTKSATVTQRAN